MLPQWILENGHHEKTFIVGQTKKSSAWHAYFSICPFFCVVRTSTKIEQTHEAYYTEGLLVRHIWIEVFYEVL